MRPHRKRGPGRISTKAAFRDENKSDNRTTRPVLSSSSVLLWGYESLLTTEPIQLQGRSETTGAGRERKGKGKTRGKEKKRNRSSKSGTYAASQGKPRVFHFQWKIRQDGSETDPEPGERMACKETRETSKDVSGHESKRLVPTPIFDCRTPSSSDVY